MLEAARELDEVAMLERAQKAAAMAELIRATYGALVEQVHHKFDKAQDTTKPTWSYLTTLQGYFTNDDDAQATRDAAVALDVVALQKDLPQAPPRLFKLLDHFQTRLRKVHRPEDVSALLLDPVTLQQFEYVESMRKGARARLPQTRAGESRRGGFNDSTVRIYPLDYRWSKAQVLLQDIYEGLHA